MSTLGVDQSEIADAINRKYQGFSQRERNKRIAQAQGGDASSFQQQYGSELAQAQQPTEFWGAGRKVAENQAPDLSAANLISPLSKLGGDYYYYGENDPSKAQWGTGGYNTADIGNGQYNILGKEGNVLGTGYKSLQDTIRELGIKGASQSITPTTRRSFQWNPGVENSIYGSILDNPNWAPVISSDIGPIAYINDNPVPYLSKDQLGKYTDQSGFDYKGNFYDSMDAANAAIANEINSKITGNTTRDWETLGQLLNYGGINASTNPHSLGGNLISDPIKGLQTLYGSTPLLLGDKVYGYKSDFGTDPVTNQWSTSSSRTSGGLFNKKKTVEWDVGNVGLGREILSPDWWSANTVGFGGGSPSNRYITSSLAEQNPGWLNVDYLNQNKGSQSQKLGLLGSMFSWLDPMLDKLDPGHNTVQKLTTGSSDTEGQMPYFQKIAPMILNLFTSGVGGSLLGAADAASLGNTGAALGNLAGAAIGASGIDTGYGSLANSVASGAASSAIGNLASGGDAKGTLLAALFGGLGGGAGAGVGNLTSGLGSGLSNMLSGVAQGAVSKLHDPEHMLESALSSGATRGLAGLMNQNAATPEDRRTNMNTARTATDLAKLFYKARK